MKKIELKKKRDAAVRRYHPWVFSGAVARRPENLQDGELVEIYAANGEYLATGHFQDGSILVRLLTFQQQPIDQSFWTEKINRAYQYRQTLGLTTNADTNCYRLVHAEGDGLPGLIIDIYAGVAVVQCHSIGMHKNINEICTALQSVFGESLTAIFDKSSETLPAQYAAEMENQYLFGAAGQYTALEHGHTFQIDWEGGQKTGFFLDQRDNRHLLGRYAVGKTVLNTFCYTGGFSIYALQAGAKSVESVDVSARAMELTDQNVALNESSVPHTSHTEDVMRFLKNTEKEYELMVVDPPAFAKSMKKRHNAVQGYKRLNALALQKIKPGGILFTFSCSQVVDKQLFDNTITAAAIEAGRQVRIMHHLSQPADHPVSLFHPEGSYLKGLVLYVE